MKKKNTDIPNEGRRDFINKAVIGGAGLVMGVGSSLFSFSNSDTGKPAILGGAKAFRGVFPAWPIVGKPEEQALLDVVRSSRWGRLNGTKVAEFEKEYAALNGVKNVLGVSSGTNALYTILGALDTGPGDEVIIPVYTFIATYNVVVLNYALPVFVDTDIETFQMDARKVESAITPQTKAIMPVHMAGSPVDLDVISTIARKSDIPLIEDACQAHLAEWKGKKVGNFGLAGAFSFQASKNLNCAEGGAVMTNDDTFAEICYNFHNQGQGQARVGNYGTGAGTRATNVRLTEFQGNILLAQMNRLEKQVSRRSENAAYLDTQLGDIEGITPAKLYPGTTKSAYHLYMFRYDRERFGGLSREKFLNALTAEGVPCSPGYGKMNLSDYVTSLATNKHYLKIYGERTMKEWLERNLCPENDKLADEQAVWFTQNMLLGDRNDMDQIVEAIRKIHKHAKAIDKA
ncbi:DegT/DnrJ/EryC1/StrS family aminotransferase [Sphingobacterium phlebotomi]|uniref:DegT/DnrJ/EryC1/StrS family aminotransferase n=1 Tax=Sphingobacterium phlebotomi TaxID=2605433 RepID=A0A5D4HAT3_9SPHI|nr:DegT/DnrJ/EryC1/StrS family aminotransferase [Sphingobacterium phlebotomi]TYR36615.1 DegT/DnrJ/EryC1/StrS family aminotransferase [Sphingobacterium phlebotomi]